MPRCLIVIASLALAAQAVAAPPATAPAGPGTVALTIYSSADPATFDPQAIQPATGYAAARLPGYAIVREVRRLELAAGTGPVQFSDVPGGIDPTTVTLRSLTAPDTTTILEQDYQNDIVSPDKFLARYLGKSILINRKQASAGPDDRRAPDTKEGKLLGFDAHVLILETANRQMPIEVLPRSSDIAEIKLFSQPPVVARPALQWQVQAAQAGPHDLLVSYQTQGLTWRADYVVTVNKEQTAIDLCAWASIVNASGASFANAKVKLIAQNGDAAGEPTIYPIARPATLANNASKQLELIAPKAALPVTKSYIYAGSPLPPAAGQPNLDRSPADGPRGVEVCLGFKNALAMPLPAGRARVYKADDIDAPLELLADEAADSAGKDELFTIRAGKAADLAADHKQTDFKLDPAGRTLTETFEITLTNPRKEATRIIIRERLTRTPNWTVTGAEFTRRNAHTIDIATDVPAGGQKKVVYTVKYGW